jgi:hypothetical protein
MVYNNDKLLDYLLFDEGLVTKTSSVYSYEYHLKDHLGNTRVTFQPNGTDGIQLIHGQKSTEDGVHTIIALITLLDFLILKVWGQVILFIQEMRLE